MIIKMTPAFDRQAGMLFSQQAFDELLAYLSEFSEKGDLIPGAGGTRKLRWTTGKIIKEKVVKFVYFTTIHITH